MNRGPVQLNGAALFLDVSLLAVSRRERHSAADAVRCVADESGPIPRASAHRGRGEAAACQLRARTTRSRGAAAADAHRTARRAAATVGHAPRKESTGCAGNARAAQRAAAAMCAVAKAGAGRLPVEAPPTLRTRPQGDTDSAQPTSGRWRRSPLHLLRPQRPPFVRCDA